MPPLRAPEIIVAKAARLLRLVLPGEPERCYPVKIGRNAGSDKTVEGDCATPLGDFTICARNPQSRFFLSLCLSYPNAAHAARGLAEGLIDAADYAAILAALQAGSVVRRAEAVRLPDCLRGFDRRTYLGSFFYGLPP